VLIDMFDHILVPLDGSEVAASILPFVGDLAQRLGAKVTLLTVLVPNRRAGDTETEAWAEAQAIVRRQALRLYDAGIDSNTVVAPGQPAEEIARQAGSGDFSLVAIGTRGHSGLRRGVLGSVTDEVVRTSPVPVLVLSPQAIEKATESGFSLASVTVPLDGSELAERILPLAEELAQALTLEVQLLRVISTGSMAYFAAEGVTMDTSPVEEELEEEANDYLNGIAHQIAERGNTSVWFNVMRGSPALSIIDHLKETSNNLVAVSTHGRSGFGRLLIGSVADSIIRSAGVPVLVIAPGEEAGGGGVGVGLLPTPP
jgi:nucleotide-binding universal stress UspA family protein